MVTELPAHGPIPAVRPMGTKPTMKATIERATLLKCLSHVQSVVERRNTIPILSNVLIEAAADGTLKIMATDLDLQVVESLSAVRKSGNLSPDSPPVSAAKLARTGPSAKEW